MSRTVSTQPRLSGAQPRRRLLALAAIAILLAAVAFAAGCSNSGTAPSPASTGGGKRNSDAANVKVDLTWKGVESGLVFDVAMDTHSVDLDTFDLTTLAVLRTGQGVEVAPSGWDAAKGGHHREGKLVFPSTVDGRPILDGTTRSITVVVKNVASPERSFQWTW